MGRDIKKLRQGKREREEGRKLKRFGEKKEAREKEEERKLLR
jgi:hypothetical protein